ncbi:MAG: PAS domain S-box protein [Bacteroidales bacterium]|nr:PAS domain S-box protein [Bacteroidales bacterium]
MFIIDLIYNLSTLVALSIVSGFINKRWTSTTQKGALLQGLLFGVVAMLGMMNPLVFKEGLIFDGRSVAISLSGLFFGPIAAIVSAMMAIALRIFQGGIGTIMGVSVSVASAVIGIIYHYRRKQRNKRFSMLFFFGFGFFVHTVMLLLAFTLPLSSAIAVLRNVGYAIILFYPLATILVGKILYDQEIKTNIVSALRASESLFRSLALSSPVGICKTDTNGNITFVNDRWCTIVGLPKHQIVGKHYASMVYPTDLNKVENNLKNLIGKGIPFNLEFRVNHGSEMPYWLLGQLESETDEYGNLLGYVGSLFDVDERKKSEDQLKRWELIFRSTRVGIVLGTGTQLSFNTMNPAFAHMYGYTIDELEGKPVEFVFAEDEKNRIADEVRKGYEKGFHVFESWHKKKDGTRFPVSLSITAVTTEEGEPWYRIVNVQDITERYEAEQRLLEERYRLENIIEGTNVGTWEWEVQTGENIYNERWASMLGYSIEELTPTTVETWKGLMHPDDSEYVKILIQKHFEKETEFFECEFRLKHKDGHWVWIQDRGKVFHWTSDGKPLKMYGIHIDISERKLWEQTLNQNQQKLKEQNDEYHALNEELLDINNRLRDSEQRLKEQNEEYQSLNEELIESNVHIQHINTDLKEAREKAEESDRLKSAFLANMSHEIRTPMNAIIGFSEILLRPNLTKKKQALYTGVLNASCGQLLNVINDVLDISKIETGQVDTYESELNINKLLRNIQGLFHYNAKNKGNRLEIKPSLDDNECVIISDEAKLNQILSNLVSNAVKFTDNGLVEVSYSVINDFIEFSVLDTGIGIDKRDQKLIFERFRQAEAKPKKNFGGTGLGLSICKAFAELLGGSIGVESEIGKGSRFFFTIQYKPIAINLNRIVKREILYDFRGITVLVAEDEPTNIFYITEILNETGATIIKAEDGAVAVEHFNLNQDIDIILMDVKMPNLDGVEATKIIRSINKRIPIIALTAYAMSGDKEQYLDVGFTVYHTKPIVRDELLATINQFIK